MIFSYSVEWIHSNIDWEHRFDRYTKNSFGEETSTIHWYSIMNSFLIVLSREWLVLLFIVLSIKTMLSITVFFISLIN